MWIQNAKVSILVGLFACVLVGTQFFTAAVNANGSASESNLAAVSMEAAEPSSLELGDRSAAVRNLKSQLQQLGYSFPSQPPSRRFTKATEEAVRKFQSDKGLTADGVAGPATQKKILEALGAQEVIPIASIETIADAVLIDRDSVSTTSSVADSTVADMEKAASSTTDGLSKTTANAVDRAGSTKMPPDIQRILDRGKIIVSVLDRDNPPFFMVDGNNELDGSDIRIAREIGQALGVDVEFRRSATTFNEVVDDVYQHNADIAVSKISRTLNRAKQNRFSTPYINLRQGLLLNRLQLAQDSHGEDMTAMVRSLKGKIGVIEDSSYARFAAQNFPQATVVSYPDWASVVEAVTTGEILGAYRDELEVKKIVLTRPDVALQLQTISLTDTKDSLSVVLPWDSEHLLSFVNQYLETADLVDTTDRLLETYSDFFSSK